MYLHDLCLFSRLSVLPLSSPPFPSQPSAGGPPHEPGAAQGLLLVGGRALISIFF